MSSVICAAIKDRHVLAFSYKGTTRQVEPHLLGYDSEGHLTLSAWQLTGGSGKGFRDFHVDTILGPRTTGACFSGPRPGYNPNDSTMMRIVCRI